MSEKRLLGLLAVLLGVLGGILLLAEALDFVRRPFDIDRVVGALGVAILGFAILIGTAIIYGGRYRSGGILNVILGVLALVFSRSSNIGAIVAIVSGVLAFLASEETS